MIRFRITKLEGDPVVTDWTEEILGDLSVQTAAKYVADLRREHPDGVITVERSSVIPRKKQVVVRFKIQEKDDLYYSAVFPIEQKDEQLVKVQTRHPEAEITVEEREI